MASGQLSKRFFFGSNSSIYLTTHAQHDFFYGIPQRQKQLLSLAKAQLAAQYETANIIAQSNSYVAQEIRQFSAAMENSLAKLGDDVTFAIDQLGYSLVCEFREVQWLLVQQGKLLQEIIELLRKRRKVEANELLEQGIANLANGFYNEAKDRLLRALEFDNTDYQVHRNLGFIYVHEDNDAKAVEHFHKAMIFAPSKKQKFDALGDLSRTYYATGNYREAAEYANELIKMASEAKPIPKTGTIIIPNSHSSSSDRLLLNDDEIARCWYNYGVYHGLAQKFDTCVKGLDKAIDLQRHYFVLASIDHDLNDGRRYVGDLLISKSKNARSQAISSYEAYKKRRQQLDYSSHNEIWQKISRVDESAQIIEEKLRNPSYSDLLDVNANLRTMIEIVNGVDTEIKCRKEIERIESQLLTDEKELKRQQEREDKRISRLEGLEKFKAGIREFWASIFSLIVILLAFAAMAAVLGALVYLNWTKVDFRADSLGSALLYLILLPLWWLASIVFQFLVYLLHLWPLVW
jgi:tetratricopeptide (TPR) repeat protein